jgi:hypothetical protein
MLEFPSTFDIAKHKRFAITDYFETPSFYINFPRPNMI